MSYGKKKPKLLQLNEHVCSLFSHDWRQKEIRETDRERKGRERRRENTYEGIKSKQWENLGKAYSGFLVLVL